jgi:hypothetical protein
MILSSFFIFIIIFACVFQNCSYIYKYVWEKLKVGIQQALLFFKKFIPCDIKLLNVILLRL